jgi:hypothetical protein
VERAWKYFLIGDIVSIILYRSLYRIVGSPL